MNLKNKEITVLFLLVDLCLLNTSYLLSSFFLNTPLDFQLRDILLLNISFIGTYFILSKKSTYQYGGFFYRASRIIKRALLFGLLTILIATIFFRVQILSCTIFIPIFIFFLLERLALYWIIFQIIKHYRKKGKLLKNAVVIGTDKTAVKLGCLLSNNYLYGYNFVGHVSRKPNPQYLGSVENLENLINQYRIQEFFVTFSLFKNETFIKEMIKVSMKNGVRIRLVPIKETIFDFKKEHDISGINILDPFELPLDNSLNRFTKRLFDIIFSLCIILFVFSWLFPVLGLLIRLESKGPIFFRQQRAGLNNKVFYCYKLRSMRPNEDADSRQAQINDSRITKVGAFMRRYNIDEFPQFFNVLKGDMSVVGPRPHMLMHDAYYSKHIRFYKSRHFIKPGISGWAQVHGYRGETDELWKMEKRVEYDFFYIKNQSFWLDLKIVLITFLNKKSFQNAY